jgi:hypothetical protein
MGTVRTVATDLKSCRQFQRSAGCHIYSIKFRANILLEGDSLRLADSLKARLDLRRKGGPAAWIIEVDGKLNRHGGTFHDLPDDLFRLLRLLQS